MYQFNWWILLGPDGILLIKGGQVTLLLAVSAWLIAITFGVVLGVARWSEARIFKHICWLHVEITRNTPALLQILFWYFSATALLPETAILFLRDHGFEFVAAMFALGLYHSGFVAEIVRSGLNAVPAGQFEAAESLGFSFVQSVRLVLAPQVARIVTPSLTSETVSLIKNTSLALVIGVAEITYQARYIDVYTFRGVEALAAVTAFYLVICLGVASIGQALLRRLSKYVKDAA
ncbi:amino acid ABC transporter permease [Bosea eneae]|uniref:Amino acid ABC transporter permease n=1 Tax=Bosea eneae TaxID=151454 RepID=A0ABW0J034_9HYPH